MRFFGTVRVLSAIVVLLCVMLPVTKCTQPLARATTYDYSWDGFNPLELGSWLLLLVFFWPSGLVLLGAAMRRPRVKLVLRVVEPLLALGSLYILHLQTLFTSGFAIGGRIAFVSLVCFGLASLAGSTIEAVRWRRRHPRQARARCNPSSA